jgi:ribosomal protein S27E
LISSEEAVLDEIGKLVRAGRFEEAALMYEELGMLDKANAIRESNMGKTKSINMECPHCGKSQPCASKSSEVTCQYCGKNYVIPKKVLDLL